MKSVEEKSNEYSKSGVEEKLIRYFLNNKAPEDFIYWINLIDELIDLIDFASDAQSRKIWGNWKTNLIDFKKVLENKGMKKVFATGADGNPLAGNYGKYPIVACLTADPVKDIRDVYKSLCVLIVQKIFIKDTAEKMNDFSETLRRSKNFSKAMFQIIKLLPEYGGKLNIYKDTLNKTVDGY